jgi:hypothetical protein
LELKVNVNIVSNSINRDLLEELTAAQLVRKFTLFMESEGSFSKKYGRHKTPGNKEVSVWQ